MNKRVLLISFYHEKGVSVRYLAHELNKNGYEAYILYFKQFNRFYPGRASETELKLLENLISEIQPSYIGLSVLSSLYMETVCLVNSKIKEKFDIPVIWGGVYATLFPEKALKYCDYVIRGEGERSLVELLDALDYGKDLAAIKNLAMKDKKFNVSLNPLRPLVEDLDDLGFPRIDGSSVFFIKNNQLLRGDPQLNAFAYELIASRGCPFACSYCSVINLKRLYQGKGKFVRIRSVDSVIEELREAKRSVNNLKVISFWDEIFPDEESWVEEFKEKYKKEIGLPFRIWSHPLRINKKSIENLVEAGLYEIEVGIQSGSYRVRKEIFNRLETQEEILNVGKILSDSKVPRVVYDFMVQHPFETLEDLKETFYLFLNMPLPFELQIHGLTFLPGTDIVDKALEEGILTSEELEKNMEGSMQEQFDLYWRGVTVNQAQEARVWISLVYLTQFPFLKRILPKLAYEVEKGGKEWVVIRFKKLMKQFSRARSISHKARLFLRSSGDSQVPSFSYDGLRLALKEALPELRETVAEAEDRLYEHPGKKRKG